MKINFDYTQGNKYNADIVIRKGYSVYDGWREKRYSSRKIIKTVKGASRRMQKEKTFGTVLEALACLFAIDLRINERYKSFFKCLIFYSPWRREVALMNSLKAQFKIAKTLDIRTAIEVVLREALEQLFWETQEDDDEGRRGGRRVSLGEEDAQAENAEEKSDELTDEKDVDVSLEEQIREAMDKNTRDAKAESDAMDMLLEEQLTEAHLTASDGDTATHSSNIESQIIRDSNVIFDNAEFLNNTQDVNKTEQNIGYNSAVDSPPLPGQDFGIFSFSSEPSSHEHKEMHADIREEVQAEAHITSDKSSKTNNGKSEYSEYDAVGGEAMYKRLFGLVNVPVDQPEANRPVREEVDLSRDSSVNSTHSDSSNHSHKHSHHHHHHHHHHHTHTHPKTALDYENAARDEFNLNVTSELVHAIKEAQENEVRQQISVALEDLRREKAIAALPDDDAPDNNKSPIKQDTTVINNGGR